LPTQKSFTGRRRRTTTRGVVIADVAARILISAGGIGTIIAVMGVCIFLVWVVVPLFQSANVQQLAAVQLDEKSQRPVHQEIDEYRSLTYTVGSDGRVQVFRVDNGERVDQHQLFDDRQLTDASFTIESKHGVFAFADGSVDVVDFEFITRFIPPNDLPADLLSNLKTAEPHTPFTFEKGVIQQVQQGQFRASELKITPRISTSLSTEPIQRVTFAETPAGLLVCTLEGQDDQHKLRASVAQEKSNFLTGEKSLSFEKSRDLPLPTDTRGDVAFLGLAGGGSDLYIVWEDGYLARVRTLRMDDAFLAETGRLFDDGAKITEVGFVLRQKTLIWGDDKGRVRGGFAVRPEQGFDAGLIDSKRDERAQYAFSIAKHFADAPAPLRSIAASPRNRLILAGFENGQVRLYNVTNEGLLATVSIPDGQPVEHIVFAPKEDGLLAVTPEHTYTASLDPLHPEATFASMFTKVWYEGYPTPVHAWQSSSGESNFEPKYGMIPLVFGTIKATFYAMIFGAPIALLAAVFSSEFLHPKAKSAIKPTIELMASLPSVVLGFLAALVFAPFVEKVVPTVMMLFLTIPFAFLLGAYIWQIIPQHITLRMVHWRLAFMVLPVIVGGALAMGAGPLVERLLFAGDMKAWLAWGQEIDNPEMTRYANAMGGWAILFLPICAIAVAMIVNRTISTKLRRSTAGHSRQMLAVLDMGKFLAGCALTVLLALGLGLLLNLIGADPRASYVFWGMDFSPMDIYIQRNALIVGFVMGFAIIPLIYTIADDALSAVPEHLRSASLGAGATPWQTAVRIIIPTAMSGLFSAMMIGLGRAVGETMIVLMAAGNTPILDMNIFAGFRTLSANIAVELPEAPKDGTHYRTLFLAALVLFAMTFVINTVAEAIRLRFRRRAFQL